MTGTFVINLPRGSGRSGEAKTAMQTLARYATQYGFSTQTLQSLDKIEDEVKKTALATMRQADITWYF